MADALADVRLFKLWVWRVSASDKSQREITPALYELLFWRRFSAEEVMVRLARVICEYASHKSPQHFSISRADISLACIPIVASQMLYAHDFSVANADNKVHLDNKIH